MLESYLRNLDAAWPGALAQLLPRIHPVDRDATRIWFSLYPLLMHELSEAAIDRPAFETYYQLRGPYRLALAAHTSHRFLYGHRYWPQARELVLSFEPQETLEAMITAMARRIDAPESHTLGVIAIALMTLRQAPAAMRSHAPTGSPPKAEAPEKWIARRTGNGTSWFSRLSRQGPRITFDEQAEFAFPLQPTQDITMAACEDKRPYHLNDARCFEGMGPIPVECRSGSCGTCWIGVLGGNENLSAVTPYERKRMEYLGYWDAGFEDPAAERPLIRLACQTQASGTASIVIPSWCGVFGPTRRERHNKD